MVQTANPPNVAPPRSAAVPLDCYLPLRDLAHYSGISVRKLREHLREPADSLPHFKVGGRILVRRSEFDAWMLRHRRVSSDDLNGLIDDVLASLGTH